MPLMTSVVIIGKAHLTEMVTSKATPPTVSKAEPYKCLPKQIHISMASSPAKRCTVILIQLCQSTK
jgi:hypothetical protein